jgi:hypothetical protein
VGGTSDDSAIGRVTNLARLRGVVRYTTPHAFLWPVSIYSDALPVAANARAFLKSNSVRPFKDLERMKGSVVDA